MQAKVLWWLNVNYVNVKRRVKFSNVYWNQWRTYAFVIFSLSLSYFEFSYQMSDCTFLCWSGVTVCCVGLVIRWRPLVLLNSKLANQHTHTHTRTPCIEKSNVGSIQIQWHNTQTPTNDDTVEYFARYFFFSRSLRSAWTWSDHPHTYHYVYVCTYSYIYEKTITAIQKYMVS